MLITDPHSLLRFFRACEAGEFNIVSDLAQYIDLNIYGKHSMRLASINGHINIVKFFINKGIYFKDALDYASAFNHQHIVKYFKEVKLVNGKIATH